ncbi:MAG: hypothetical protein ABSA77_04255 [Thermoguttaceae bacterium]
MQNRVQSKQELRRFLGRRSCVLQARGNALGMMNQTMPDSAQRANFSRRGQLEQLVRWTDKQFPFSLHLQGVALGWKKIRPFEAANG